MNSAPIARDTSLFVFLRFSSALRHELLLSCSLPYFCECRFWCHKSNYELSSLRAVVCEIFKCGILICGGIITVLVILNGLG